MSLSERLVEVAANATARECKLAKVVSGLAPRDQVQLVAMLETPVNTPGRVTNVAIGQVLRSEGFNVADSLVDRHRRGSCKCYAYEKVA